MQVMLCSDGEKARVVFHFLSALPLIHTQREARSYLGMIRATMFSMTRDAATQLGYMISGPVNKMFPHVQIGLNREGHRCVFKTCSKLETAKFEELILNAVHALAPCDFLCSPFGVEEINQKPLLVSFHVVLSVHHVGLR